MHRPFLPRLRGQPLLVAAAFCAGQACQDDASPPGTDGANMGPDDVARLSPSGVFHVAQFGGASTVYRMNYVGSGAQ